MIWQSDSNVVLKGKEALQTRPFKIICEDMGSINTKNNLTYYPEVK